MHNPLGVLWLQLQATLVSIFTLGVLAGPMQVGLFSVLLHYVRTGEWKPERLWGHVARQNVLAGLVYVAFGLAVLVVGLPFAQTSPALSTLFNFATLLVVNLVWFYTFLFMTEQPMHWTAAIRKGWDLMQRGGLLAHVILIAVLQLLNSLPTDTVPIPIQAVILLVLFTFATLNQSVAYAQLRSKERVRE